MGQTKMNDAERAEATAQAIVAGMTTEQLCEAFEATNSKCDATIPTIRGWIMDELARRDPEAFAAWIDCQTDLRLIDLPSVFFVK